MEPAGEGAGAAGQVECFGASTSHAGFAANDPDGRCAQGPILQVGDDLFDDRVPAVIRRLTTADRPTWSLREFASTFYVNPRRNPDFGWAFASRFMFVLAYAFLTTYQAYYLLDQIGSTETDVPQQNSWHPAVWTADPSRHT